jgi:RimJ/RimL family protein N-acetyltransferase
LSAHVESRLLPVELYRVQRDKLARCYSHEPRDLGVHIAIGEPDAIGRGVGSALLRAVAEGLLAADRDCVRVAAEPNVHNGASVGAFGKAGFGWVAEVGLPNKNSALMVFGRAASG